MADQLKLPLSHRRKLSNCRPPTRIFKFIFQSRTGISTVEESRAELRVESNTNQSQIESRIKLELRDRTKKRLSEEPSGTVPLQLKSIVVVSVCSPVRHVISEAQISSSGNQADTTGGHNWRLMRVAYCQYHIGEL